MAEVGHGQFGVCFAALGQVLWIYFHVSRGTPSTDYVFFAPLCSFMPVLHGQVRDELQMANDGLEIAFDSHINTIDELKRKIDSLEKVKILQTRQLGICLALVFSGKRSDA